jgi:hypothetical protein
LRVKRGSIQNLQEELPPCTKNNEIYSMKLVSSDVISA